MMAAQRKTNFHEILLNQTIFEKSCVFPANVAEIPSQYFTTKTGLPMNIPA